MLVPDIPTVLSVPEQVDLSKIDLPTLSDDVFDSIIPYRSEDMFFEELNEPKKYSKFIKSIERIARSSSELRRLVRYLVDDLDMSKCALLQGVNVINAKIELHHYPFTLYDLTDIIIQNKLATGKKFSQLDIVSELVEIHYRKMVGLVPLSKTVHELAHNGKVFINLKHVFGNVKDFIFEYRLGISQDHIDNLKRLIELSESEASNNLNLETLQVKPISWVSSESSFGDLLLNDLSDENSEE